MVNALRCAHPALREPHRNAIAAAAVGLLPAGEHPGPGRHVRPGPFRAPAQQVAEEEMRMPVSVPVKYVSYFGGRQAVLPPLHRM